MSALLLVGPQVHYCLPVSAEIYLQLWDCSSHFFNLPCGERKRERERERGREREREREREKEGGRKYGEISYRHNYIHGKLMESLKRSYERPGTQGGEAECKVEEDTQWFKLDQLITFLEFPEFWTRVLVGGQQLGPKSGHTQTGGWEGPRGACCRTRLHSSRISTRRRGMHMYIAICCPQCIFFPIGI